MLCDSSFTLDNYDTLTAILFGTSCKAMGSTNCVASIGNTCKLCIKNFTLKFDLSGC